MSYLMYDISKGAVIMFSAIIVHVLVDFSGYNLLLVKRKGSYEFSF